MLSQLRLVQQGRLLGQPSSSMLGIAGLAFVLALGGCGLVGGSGEPPEAPSALRVTSGAGEVSVRWDGVEEADSYNVYRTRTPREALPSEPQAQGITEARLTDGAVENGQTYHYRVTAVNDDGESAPSDDDEATPFPGPPGPPNP
ncbi:hypothetical protein GGP57_000282 [Salinibacter ruber]|uniref:fibronectin type III domain-containing protein n=1 Tax=Salinibacter ruber TaxID=146919 RepID=UPI002167178A|nr:fibronectin type III domain-containing protein [Salinibacter ruber]MCS3632991.1 hypothetical protein [Salinibacter ruber]MCS3713234.1 hypothetical protein [Salinibacter ruber]